MIWINLGCGNNPLPKPWINVDKYYYPATHDRPGTELMNRADGNPEDFLWFQGDFTDLSDWGDKSVDKINMCHALEHVSWQDALKTLDEIYRVLKPDCDVEIEVPDLTKAFQFDFMTMIDLVYGGRDNNVYWGGHFCGFTPVELMERLFNAGFTAVEEAPVGYGTSKPEPDRNFRMRGIK